MSAAVPTDGAAPRRKLCMVTGASSGIGKVTAQKIAQAGYDVVLVCRDRGRGEAAADEVRRLAPQARVELMLADLSSLAAVRQLAHDFLQRHARLDVLVNNAGTLLTKRHVTVDGHEATFATNHLAPFLLTNLLLPALERAAPARIVNLGSEVHRSGAIDFDDLDHRRHYGGYRVYCSSKLANVLFTYELARRLEGRGVTVTCVHPGVVGSHFGQDADNGLFRFAYQLARPFMMGVEKGAAPSVYLATSPEVEGQTGKYFVRFRATASSKRSQDPALAARLWQASEQLTGLTLSA